MGFTLFSFFEGTPRLFRQRFFLLAARTNDGAKLSYHFQQNNHDATGSIFIKGGVGGWRERSNDSNTLTSAGRDGVLVHVHSCGMMQHLNVLPLRRISASTHAVLQVSVVRWGIRTFHVCASRLAQIRPEGSLILGIRTTSTPCGTQIGLLDSLTKVQESKDRSPPVGGLSAD